MRSLENATAVTPPTRAWGVGWVALVLLLAAPRGASAAGAAFEAEVGQRTGSLVTVSDAAACSEIALSASTTTNDLSISLTVATAGTYVLWMRVKAPASSDRAAWVAVDASGVFQDPGDLFDIHEDSTGTYIWRRVTRRGSGTSSAPQDDPRLLVLGAGPHTLEIRLREADLLLDKLALSNRLDYVPIECESYVEPPPPDGGGSDGGPTPGDRDQVADEDHINGVRAADCPADQYYDLKRRACLAAGEPSRCGATRAPFWAGLLLLLLGCGRGARRSARPRWGSTP